MRWDTSPRGSVTFPLLLTPGSTATSISLAGRTLSFADAPRRVAQARIDLTRYAAAPIDTRDRARPLWLTAIATLSLLLAALAPRCATVAVLAVAMAWSIGLWAAIASRPAIDRVADADAVWLIARRPGTASCPIANGVAWVPVVESLQHWRSLAPRIDVDADGRATLRLTFAAEGARVRVEPSR